MNDFIFNKTPENIYERWQLIIHLIERWRGTVVEINETKYKDKIELLENKCDLKFSKGIKYWICFVEHLIDIKQYEWIFRDCYEVDFRNDINALTLQSQGESDYYWAIRKENIQIEDPPVEGFYLDYDLDEGKFVWDRLVSESVSGFVLKYLLDYHSIFKGNGFGVKIANLNQELDAILSCFDNYIKFEDYWIMESKNIIAAISKFHDSYNLRVQYLDNAIYESTRMRLIVEEYLPKRSYANF